MPYHDAVTVQAFNGDKPSRMLIHQIGREPHRWVHFRNAANGEDILAVPAIGHGGVDGLSLHHDIQRLPAHWLGTPGTTRTYSREALRTVPHDDDSTAADGERCDGAAGRCIHRGGSGAPWAPAS